jgi:hypothetical protein
MRKQLARYLEKQLADGIPASVAIDKAFESGLIKPDTRRVRQETEDLYASLASLRRRISVLRCQVRRKA